MISIFSHQKKANQNYMGIPIFHVKIKNKKKFLKYKRDYYSLEREAGEVREEEGEDKMIKGQCIYATVTVINLYN